MNRPIRLDPPTKISLVRRSRLHICLPARSVAHLSNLVPDIPRQGPPPIIACGNGTVQPRRSTILSRSVRRGCRDHWQFFPAPRRQKGHVVASPRLPDAGKAGSKQLRLLPRKFHADLAPRALFAGIKEPGFSCHVADRNTACGAAWVSITDTCLIWPPIPRWRHHVLKGSVSRSKSVRPMRTPFCSQEYRMPTSLGCRKGKVQRYRRHIDGSAPESPGSNTARLVQCCRLLVRA